ALLVFDNRDRARTSLKVAAAKAQAVARSSGFRASVSEVEDSDDCRVTDENATVGHLTDEQLSDQVGRDRNEPLAGGVTQLVPFLLTRESHTAIPDRVSESLLARDVHAGHVARGHLADKPAELRPAQLLLVDEDLRDAVEQRPLLLQ